MPIMAIGSPGNDRQPQAMVQVLLDILAWGMNPQEAVEQPRYASYSFPASSFPHRYEPGKLRVEAGISDETLGALRRRGHDVEGWPRWSWSAGGVCVVARDPETGVCAGGADPRREGYVAAL
jgi:gamma-glutamyltranspeptidase/glutathione hydrolase